MNTMNTNDSTINESGEKIVLTHEDIPEIPEGIELPSSEGSLVEDIEEPIIDDDYSDVNVDNTIEVNN